MIVYGMRVGDATKPPSPLLPDTTVNAKRLWLPVICGVIDSPDSSSVGPNGELESWVGNAADVYGQTTLPESGAGIP